MNEKLQIIRHLYGEAPDDESLRELLVDEDARREYRALGEAKFVLDHRRRERPDPAVLDAVFAAAAGDAAAAGSPRRARADRGPAHRLALLRRRSAGVVGAVLAMGLLVSVGLWQWLPVGAPAATENVSQALPPEAPSFADASPAASAQPPASSFTQGQETPPAGNAFGAAVSQAPLGAAQSSGASRAKAAPPSLAGFQATASQGEAPSVPAEGAFAVAAEAGNGAPPSPEDVIEWRDSEEQLRAFYRRLEQLQARSEGLAWNEPALPLEMLPAAGRGDGALLPARQQH